MLVTVDTHTHSAFSADATEGMTIENMCEEALKKGLTMLAITDHYDLPMPKFHFDIAKRKEIILQAKEKYKGRLTLLHGVELGEPVSDYKEAERILKEGDFDIVLASAHAVTGSEDFYDLPYKELSDAELLSLWEQYLSELLTMAKHGKISVLSHIRYPERYYRREGRAELLQLDKKAKTYFEPIFKAMIERGIFPEINVKAPLQPGREPDPGLELLKFYKELGGEYVTTGSDAHRLVNIGANCGIAGELLEAAGLSFVRDPEQFSVWKNTK